MVNDAGSKAVTAANPQPRRASPRKPRQPRAGVPLWLRAARWLWAWFSRQSPKVRLRLVVAALVAAVTLPIWMLNLAVAFFGQTVVFPLSPFFLREKVQGLLTYAVHRPLCLAFDHPEMGPVVAQAEQRHRLPRGLLAAIIQVESGGKPHRISPAGAMGPGQLMPGTARMLGVADPFDTAQNVDGAARLLASHLQRYRRRLRLAVAAYHAGPGAVRGHVPQNGQTPGYVARVMREYTAIRNK